MTDNRLIGGIIVRSKDVGGDVQAFTQTVVDHNGADVLGLAVAEPAAHTLLGRLRAIAAGLDETIAAVERLSSPNYAAVPASSTDQELGEDGSPGDQLGGLLIIPSSLSPGPVSIRDGDGGSAIPLFAGGEGSLNTLHPFFIPFGALATNDGWRVTTGDDVAAIAVGRFN